MTSKFCSTSIMRTSILYGIFASTQLISPLLAQQPTPDPSPIPPPSQPAPASPNAPTAPLAPSAPRAAGSPSSHLMRTWRRLSYTCDGGVKVVVNLHAKQAHVIFKGRTYNMKQIDESNGQKYTDGFLVWRNKDEVGALDRASKSGGTKSLAASCHLHTIDTNPPETAAHPQQ